MNIDPRLFGSAAQVMNGSANTTVADIVARNEIAKLKQFIATKVGGDVQMLTKAISDLNAGTEKMFAAVLAKIEQIEQMLGGEVVAPTVSGTVVEAANVQPGDENLPPAYFHGSDEESAP